VLSCRDGKLHLVWSCEWRLRLRRERDRRERECVCCCAVWRRNGRRKGSYNVGVPISNPPPPTSGEESLVVNRAGKRVVLEAES